MSESDHNQLNSTSQSPEYNILYSLGFITKVDLNRFNSYPDISNVPVTGNSVNDDVYFVSPLEQSMGTRLSARKADAEKQECTLKAVSILVKEIDTWVIETKGATGLPNLDLLTKQRGLF